MHCPVKTPFEFAYENGTTASYMVIKSDGQENVKGYQVEMIRNSKIDYILPLDVRRKDDKVYFYYNVTSRLVLSQYLKRKKLGREEFLKLLMAILRALLDCRHYLLAAENLLLDSDYIFVDPSTGGVSFAYIPLMTGTDIRHSLREFIIDLILYKADIDESSNDNFLQRILGHVKSETLNLTELDKLVKSLISREDAEPHRDEADVGLCADYISCEPAQKVCEQAQVRENRSHLAKPEQSLSLPKERFDAGLLIAALVSQMAIILILILVSKFVKPFYSDTTTYAAIVLIAEAVDILILKKLFGKKALAARRKKAAPSKGQQAELPAMEERIIADGHDNVKSSPETSLLEGPKQVYPCLKSSPGGKWEDIPIDKPDL